MKKKQIKRRKKLLKQKNITNNNVPENVRRSVRLGHGITQSDFNKMIEENDKFDVDGMTLYNGLWHKTQ